MSFNTISVIGLGYIGLPTATIFASKNKKVIGIDINKNIVETVNQGKIHIVEPNLDIMVNKAVNNSFLKASTEVEPADAFIITVPTPLLSSQKKDAIPEPDISFIKAASKSISKVLKKDDLIILESTSPVGTTDRLVQWLADDRPDLTFPHTHGENSDIRVAYCPERVLPGNIINELVSNDRVIGGMTQKCCECASSLYKIFLEGNCIVTNSRTAEMTKLTENSFRDVNIAFANELSMICDSLKIDVWELIRLANRHPRVNILKPGPGVGGHCIAVDPWFIVSSAPETSKLIHSARKVNNIKPDWIIDKVYAAVDEFLSNNPKKNITDLTVACFGIAYKPDIDDLRESPALSIVETLTKEINCKFFVVEPNIKYLPKSLEKCDLIEPKDVPSNCFDIALLLVNHKEFNTSLNIPTWECFTIDACGLLDYN